MKPAVLLVEELASAVNGLNGEYSDSLVALVIQDYLGGSIRRSPNNKYFNLVGSCYMNFAGGEIPSYHKSLDVSRSDLMSQDASGYSRLQREIRSLVTE